MTLIVLLVGVYVGLYVVLSVPKVQEKIKEKICTEVSPLLGGDLGVRKLGIRPFSEVILTDVSLDSPSGDRCISIGKVAAGIDIWALFTERRIIFNYAEILRMDVELAQPYEGAPLNIQFLIDALSPKDKDKPSSVFDIRIRNIVVRDSKASYSRPWLQNDERDSSLSPIGINRLRMDLSIPELRNDLFRFAIRNIQFEATPGILLRGLSAEVAYSKDLEGEKPDRISVKDFELRLQHSTLKLDDMSVSLATPLDLDAKLNGSITPADVKGLLPQLATFNTAWDVVINASLKDKRLEIATLDLVNSEHRSRVSFIGSVADVSSKDSIDAVLEDLHAELSSSLIAEVLAGIPGVSGKLRQQLYSVGNVDLDIKGKLMGGDRADASGVLSTDEGNVEFKLETEKLRSSRPLLATVAKIKDLNLGKLLGSGDIGKISMELDADVVGFDNNADGRITVVSDECTVFGNHLSGIDIDVKKSGEAVGLSMAAESGNMSVALDADVILAGENTDLDAEIELKGINPHKFGAKGKMADMSLSGVMRVNTHGDNLDNILGKLDLNSITIVKPDGRKLALDRLSVTSDTILMPSLRVEDGLHREIKLSSDWLDASLVGKIHPSKLVGELKDMIGDIFPVLLVTDKEIKGDKSSYNDFTFDINVKGASAPYEFFEIPVRPLIDIPIKGRLDTRKGKGELTFSTPHLQQGRNKLIRDVDFALDVDAFSGMAMMRGGLIFPAKKGDAQLAVGVLAMHDKVDVDLRINPTIQSVVKGGLGLTASFSRLPDSFKSNGALAVNVDILPSVISVNDKAWSVGEGAIDYFGKKISVSNFLISHEDQYVRIDGTASESSEDMIKVRLNDIDLEYIFNLLNINYVSFGGMATGEVSGSRLLTNTPEAKTDYLKVKGLSYNGAVLGDADLASDYDVSAQKVGIYGVIRDPLTRERRASVDGGVWVTRDSLSFDFDARKVNVGIMRPFVSAFCSDLEGAASGKCKLFGTFSDIDLVGDLVADTISMKLDFTNTWYHAGNDSVFLHRGVIEVPPLTLYDDEGHSGEFSGWLRHTYFHNPVFGFRLRDAKNLLCYDTNEKINPLWYGTIYGSGHAQINGYPGQIDIDMNMTTDEGSKFYYVITDTEDVDQSSFLSFTDRRKESLKSTEADSIPDYLLKFRKKTEELKESSSNVVLSIKGTVTNNALVTLVMDPRAGDNITARGQGALQMDYNLASNELRMIGTYVLDEGNYNFTLQDIIIKNFNIRKGSMIKFDGDPMKAILDIAATYRVNTNLTDLDKSFSTDKELNRTNVPVDAVLLVDGPMTNPDITFDIELPSLTSDVERKVKSIVSTNDMMSRQIIYLLALNRFYTPEYTGGQSNGSEWSSMASSTISSQLSNILSQMTDKLDVAPSFRSEKGDFSDMEFDLALSSRLLNNRLLINGNFGYRDRTTSNTQFVGDFDIEYLLSKNGNLRLKAYNHFNDQNYYLRSALTTQGVGVIFRRDFDRLFRRKKEEKEKSMDKEGLSSGEMEASDSLGTNGPAPIEKDKHN